MTYRKENINECIDKLINKILNETSEETSAAAGLPGFDMPHTNTKRKNKKILQDENKESNNNENIERESKRLMIDFDGVIHSYHEGWKDGSIYGYVIEGSKEAINELSKTHQIVIFTTRVSPQQNLKHKRNLEEQEEMVGDWLTSHGIYFDFITADKLSAIAYIDDKGITFNNNWEDVKNKIHSITKTTD